MSNVTPEIKTKFSLGGVAEAASGFKKFGQSARESINNLRQSGARALEPFQKDIEKTKKSLATLKNASLTVGGAGFGAIKKGADTAFKTITIGAASAVAALASVSAAAIKVSKDTASEWDKLDKQSRALGVSPEDLSVLGFAGAQEGVSADEIVKGLGKIGTGFLSIKEKIADANSEFDAFKQSARRDAWLSLKGGSVEGLTTAGDAVGQARMKSLSGVQERQATLRSYIQRASPYESRSLQGALFVQRLRKELTELEKTERDLKRSFGPLGEALFGLEKYGLNIEKASKGGMEGLLALSDAFQRVEDPAERLRFSVQLFGDDAGKKMVPLLDGGRKAIEDYRRELERLGGVVSKKDTEIGSAYAASAENFKRSMGGVRMAIAREVLPMLTESTDAMTEFMVSYREKIASVFKTGFVYARNFVTDIISIFQGKRTGFKTGWLDTFFEKLKSVRAFVSDMSGELKKLWSGENSRFEWLNKIRDGLQTAIRFVKDLYAVLRGQDAKEFKWLNGLRDQAKAFGQDFMAALEMVKSVLSVIHELLRPVADLFGTDVTTMLLFLGMMKFIGLLGAATTAIGVMGKAIGALFAMGGGGALAKGIAGIATAAGGASAVGGIGTAAAGAGAMGLGAKAGVLGAAVVGGGMLGHYGAKKAYEWSGAKGSADLVWQRQQELNRLKTDQAFNAAWEKWDDKRKGDYFRSRGVNTKMGLPLDNNLLPGGVMDVWSGAGMRAPSVHEYAPMSAKSGSRETVDVNLTLNDKKLGTMQTDPFTARKMKQTLHFMQQQGGY
ncbi:hypothetical protein [Pseudochrobactrum asaccharolyticum]|uniref:hypothetical protein n=1 Tax=Pseudochrobactrum asaccharolyticum TaxID=354351 RepID=UPI0040418364